MEELLRLMAGPLMFFLYPHEYRIVNSKGTAKGNALIDLQHGELRWRLLRDRSQLHLELGVAPKYASYSPDILMRWLGDAPSTGLLTEEAMDWLRTHLSEIERTLEHSTREQTLREWDELTQLRAASMRGPGRGHTPAK